VSICFDHENLAVFISINPFLPYIPSLETNVGWPKYGNFGFAWDPTYLQTFPLSSEFVEHFNKIALDVIQKSNFGDIHTMDGYWISLPRPDHTEVSKINGIGPHLVHPGPEVIGAMTEQWLLYVLRYICSDIFAL